MPFSDPSTTLGLGTAAVLFVVILARQRRFEIGDLGSIIVVFFAATNIVPALYITYFGTNATLLATLPRELFGYGKYLTIAGICSTFISCFTIWSYAKKVW
jgi:hypothetical protein